MKGVFMKIFGSLFALLIAFSPVFGDPEPFYLGTYTGHSSSKGIYEGSLDSESGKLGPVILAALTANPSFLALSPGGNALYAAGESPGVGRLQAFGREPHGGLFPLNVQSAGGSGACYVTVDPGGQNVLIANYGSGSIACFRIQPNGALGLRTAFIPFAGSGPNAKRQEGPHAHSIYVSPDDAFVYACDLGSDRVWIFKFDGGAGTLVPATPPFAIVPPGSGPRHLAFSLDGKYVYVANEMGHTVSVFFRDVATGILHPLQTVDALPAGTPAENVTTAEIVLHPSGKWVYVSNRGCDTVSVFAPDPMGRLNLIQSISAGVNFPRSIAVDPSGRWMIAAGQKDNRIAVLKIDPQTGLLSATLQSAQVGSPVCILFEGP
jgi:6-phosphogluconolactonase